MESDGQPQHSPEPDKDGPRVEDGRQSEDWFLLLVEEVAQAVTELRRELVAGEWILARARTQREEGVPLPAIAVEFLHQAGAPRRIVATAFHQYERAVSQLRAGVVASLVDDEGLTLSTLAREMELSRQVVTRLYQAGRSTKGTT